MEKSPGLTFTEDAISWISVIALPADTTSTPKKLTKPDRRYHGLLRYLIGQNFVGQKCWNFGLVSKILTYEKFCPTKSLPNFQNSIILILMSIHYSCNHKLPSTIVAYVTVRCHLRLKYFSRFRNIILKYNKSKYCWCSQGSQWR